MKYAITMLAMCAVLLSGCKERPGQNTYNANEVGVSRAVEFGTVLNVREVNIQGDSSGTGTLLGAGAGAATGSAIGKGSGKGWATIGVALVGAIAGNAVEQEINNRKGLEYVVQLQSGETKTIVQEEHEGDIVFREGDNVMVQYCDAGDKARKCTDGKSYQRLFPVKKLPAYTKKRRQSVTYDVEPAEL